MAKVFLRVYNREIESMIEGGQLDEAIAHCQNILKVFPMHIETYRLLGKAFLEGRKYADAADIFQRALMAVPDDFVSHVGMSIIRDDESKLDDAIWHMERAFEVQPSNAAIQGELRRLYGRRDGVEPSKIRLSRDALANMYSQGELFNQAIAEIRSVLSEDPNRPDLQVMLARAYYRSGQKVEAAEMASTLLKKYPYCMDALRILVDVLPGTGAADSTQMYRQRLRLLDPYSAYCIDSVFTSDQVADSTVSLDRLEFKPGPISASAQPDWASSLGIKLEGEQSSQNPPDWMQAGESADQPMAPAPQNPVTEPNIGSEAASDSVPDWMRSAGWQESAGTVQAGTTGSGEAFPDDSSAKAEIPDWLKSMAPADMPAEPVSEPEQPVSSTVDTAGDGIPDWLKGVAPAAAAAMDIKVEGEPAVEPQPKVEDGTPDWLTPMAPKGSADVAAMQDQPPVQLQPADSDAAPDWLKSMTPAVEPDISPIASDEPVQPATSSEDEIPDWLKPMAPTGSADVAAMQDQTPVQSQPAGRDAAPDWLKSQTPAVEADISPNAVQEPVQPASSIEDDIPDWLKSPESLPASDDTPVVSPEPVQPPASGATETPDWLKALSITEPAAEPQLPPREPVEAQPTNEEDLPDWLKSMAPAETTAAADSITTSITTEVMSPAVQPTGLEAHPLEEGDSIEGQKDIGARAESAGEAVEVSGDSLPQPAMTDQPVQEQPVPPAPAPQEPAKPRVSLSPAQDKQFRRGRCPWMAGKPGGKARCQT